MSLNRLTGSDGSPQPILSRFSKAVVNDLPHPVLVATNDVRVGGKESCNRVTQPFLYEGGTDPGREQEAGVEMPEVVPGDLPETCGSSRLPHDHAACTRVDHSGVVPDLSDVVDEAWAEALGCAVELLHTPGVHLVPGGPALADYRGVYMAHLGSAVFVYAPASHQAGAKKALAMASPDDAFTASTCRLIAQGDGDKVLGPSWHGFADVAIFRPAEGAGGQIITADDPQLDELRRACGTAEWAEAGFAHTDGHLYGLREDGRLVAAGDMTDYRGRPADVGVITHPAMRGRGLARRLVSYMVSTHLPAAGVVRYRALTTNYASLAVARPLGFIGRGQNLAVRLRSQKS